METDVFFGAEAQEKLFNGMEKVYKAVSVTLGSRGRNAVYRRWGIPLITNDGVSIARRINLRDAAERMGADLVKEAAEKTNREAGDGTTTAIILTYHLINEGKKILATNPEVTPMQLRRQLEDALDKVLLELPKRATQVTSLEELTKVAMISAEDKDVANLVASCVDEVGDTGRVVAQESEGMSIEKERIEGMEWEGGFISAAFINNPEKNEIVLDDVLVAVVEDTLTFQNEILNICSEIAAQGTRSVVLICKEAQSEALTAMVLNHVKGDVAKRFHCIPIRAPQSPEMLKDLAALIGKDSYSGQKTSKKLGIAHATKVKKIVATKEKTLIIKGERTEAEEKMYMERVSMIKTLLENAKPDEKIGYEDRLARITGSVILIHVGASTDAEMKYLYAKIEDAINAVKAAKKEGYIAGGGITLRSICAEVDKDLLSTGSLVLAKAASMPVEILIRNSGAEYKQELINEKDGFDTDTGTYVKDVAARGIIDPVLVSKNALKYAVSLASMFLTAETLIVDIPQEKSA